ncbi:MAG: protein translocase subunit SecF [Candidatus Gastranaerophilales bacterium]|nr:protein translocase subunit SecF [Candidatus Gastranaerophilales bacterium]
MANTNLIKNNYKIDIIKFRYLFLAFTGILLIPCIAAIIYLMSTQANHAPLKLGIDFTGGTILQYSVDKKVATEDIGKIRTNIEAVGVKNPVIQTTTQAGIDNSDVKNLVSIRTTFLGDKESKDKANQITQALKKDFSNAELVQVNSVGPTLGSELLKNTLMALGLAFILMVIYISFRFQVEYGWIALLTLFQNAIFVVGFFAIKGIFFDTAVDSLFITAMLTVIGYSINDTIVVFDRIRENMRFLAKKHSSSEIINASINQTLARSINTSSTTLFTLFALYLFGGSTIKDFVLAIIVGVIVGTYSSIFTAGTILSIVKEKMAKKDAQ